MKKGNCKLCGQYKDLCKESHIIPRFLYKLLVGENNSLIYLDAKGAKIRFNGEYEAHILCEECEGKIGIFDDYFSKLINNNFRQKLNLRLKKENSEDVLVLENDQNYDYTKIKLFLLSMLWRSSISSRPFFKNVKLSHALEEELRTMILTENAGEIYEYPCKIFLPPMIDGPSGKGFDLTNMGFTMFPFCYKKDSNDICAFVITGTQYIILLDKKQSIRNFSVTKDRLVMSFNTLDSQKQFTELMAQTMKKTGETNKF